MTKLQSAVVGALFVGGVATTLFIQHQARARLRQLDESARVQTDQLAQLRADHDRFARLAGEGGGAGPNSVDDLLRLRAEVGALREQTNALTALQEQNRRLRAWNPSLAEAPRTPLAEREETLVKMNYSKLCALAAIMYADDHGNRFPTNLDQTSVYRTRDDLFTDPELLLDQFEFLGSGLSVKQMTNAMNTLILREKQARQFANGNWGKVYAFADGHAEMRRFPSLAELEAFEKVRLPPPPNP